MLEVEDHMGQGQRSLGSRSKVTLVKVSLKVIILAGGLTSTSSCIFCNVQLETNFIVLHLSKNRTGYIIKAYLPD